MLQATSDNIGMVAFADQHECSDCVSSQLVGERFTPVICELSTCHRWYIPTPEASENIRIATYAGRWDYNDYASSKPVRKGFAPASCNLSTSRGKVEDSFLYL